MFSEYQQILAASDGLKSEFENKSLSRLQKQTMFGNVLASKFKQTVFYTVQVRQVVFKIMSVNSKLPSVAAKVQLACFKHGLLYLC